MERGEHPVPGEHLSRSLKPWGGRWGGAIGMELQGSREQSLGQQQKPGARRELRDARWQRGFVRRCPGEGCRVSSLGSSRCSGEHWRDTSKVAPHLAWLGLSWACRVYFCTDFPGSEGSSACFCLWPAACWQTWMQMPHPRRASLVQMARFKVSKGTSPRQHTQPMASSAPLPFPAQGGSQAVRAM